MLRNIPNKVNQAELKQILDQSSFGKFDFAYLRIDFSNDCKYVQTRQDLDEIANRDLSVGYAFINFADVSDVSTMPSCANFASPWTSFRYVLDLMHDFPKFAQFVEAHAGKRW